MRLLRYCLIRQYNNIDVYNYKFIGDKRYSNYKDYIVDIKENNFNYQKDENFNFVSNRKFIIENAKDDIAVMYIIFRIKDCVVYYGITTSAIEFNPENDVILYYKKLNLKNKFMNTLVEFYFESRQKEFYDKYDPMYYALFYTIDGKKPVMEFTEINISDYYYKELFELPKMPPNFKLTNQNPIVPVRTPIAIRNYVYNKNIENLLDKTYYTRRTIDNYVREYNETRVDNEYNINNPESMFFDFTDDMTADLSYMYINNKRYDFNKNADHVNVPKGDYALFYNKRKGQIGIKYVLPTWANTQKTNPLLRSYVYIKRLSDNENNKRMKSQIIDFYTKDHFHLYRLNYTDKDIFEMNTVSISFKDFEKKFNEFKNNYRYRQRVITNFTDRNNPYIDESIRYQY